MGRNLEPKCKQCRRIGEKLFLKGERCNTPKCAMIKRNYPPGFHGPKGKKRQTDYGLQLQEKQKAKKTYHLFEKQFKLTFDKASAKKGDVGENLFKLLEMRLDNVVYKLGFSESKIKARQLVNHGHFKVNDIKVTIPSYSVREGDVVTIVEKSKKIKHFKELVEKIKKYQAPGWLNVDQKALSGKVLHEPNMNEIQSNINVQMIVEFYSR